MDIKKNAPLIVGLAIPLLMIVFVAGSIYLPGFFSKPQIDFLYSLGGKSIDRPLPAVLGKDEFITREAYDVRGGKLVRTEVRVPVTQPFYDPGDGGAVRFLVHDVQTNTSREITLAEAQELGLDPNRESPDGFELSRADGGGGVFPFFFFDGGYDGDTYVLKGRGARHRLHLTRLPEEPGHSYGRDVRFFGWVLSSAKE